jgi:phosphatidylserine/phosphatidylglycerophosphate/cardiolipin synthase-like enzyme
VGESTSWPARQLFESAATAGRSLPPAQAERLGRALSEVATPDEAAPVAYLIPSTSFAAAVEHLLTAWRACPTVTGLSVGIAVAAAAHAHALARLSSEVELVVSGPASETVHARRTEQVLLQLISEARHEILLVTFALEMHEELYEALNGASQRGVRVTVLAEDPADYPGFRGDPGRAVRDLNVERLRWPAEARPARGAALHAKVVVVDRMTALVTSANLTQRASGDNLEAGVLIRGDDTARRIVEHIEELRGGGTLRPA